MSTIHVLNLAKLLYNLLSFPTRRSSDLGAHGLASPRSASAAPVPKLCPGTLSQDPHPHSPGPSPGPSPRPDRKSTRLNSSHVAISYAVFCLKKKNARYIPQRAYVEFRSK